MDEAKIVLIALQALGTMLIGVLWFNFKEIKSSNKTLADDLSAYKLHIAENYVTQNELTKAIDSLTKSIDNMSSKLDRIDTKLDSKQDKL